VKPRKSFPSQLAAASLARWMLEEGTPDLWARLLTDPIPHLTLTTRLRGHASSALYRSRIWLIGRWRHAVWLLASPRGRERLTARDIERFLTANPQYAAALDPGRDTTPH
jgi:hypothetical protein